MRCYQITRGAGADGLELVERRRRDLAPGEVRLRVHAVALNYRDLLVARGQMGSGEHVVPGSEAACEVVEAAPDVTRFAVGDRVSPLFFPQWLDGPPVGDAIARSLGGNTDGVLAEEIVAQASGCVAIPEGLSWAEAATMPCSGLTASTALFDAADARPGQTVAILGTGNVSLWALQLAKAAGLQAIVLSGSDTKLALARRLGADDGIVYGATPHWDEVVTRRHGGADIVLDVAGADTIARSIAALRPGGVAVAIGGVSGGFALQVPAFALIGRRRLTGAMVGSRKDAEAFAAFVALQRIRPVLDREYAFDEVPSAYARLPAPDRSGAVVIRVTQATE